MTNCSYLMPRCILCRGLAKTNDGICVSCLQSFPELGEQCMVCADRVPAGTRICGACLAQPPPFDKVIAASPYVFPTDWLIRRIKYNGYYVYTRALAGLCAHQIALRTAGDDLPDCIVPVPLYPARMRQRGFNQSLELARVLAHKFHINMDWRCIQKVKSCQPQTALSLRQRKQNPKGTFKLNYLPCARHIAIVDDVMTTGATAAAVARVLCHPPVERIDIWVAARTYPK